ncbi:hypothetical protein JT358_02585 [Micrococcales bacterium 31B]|nr:hypothetical protein [Micrococcales bacterium 31B]
MWQALVCLVVAGFLGGGAWSMASQGKPRSVVVLLVIPAVVLAAFAVWMLVEVARSAAAS